MLASFQCKKTFCKLVVSLHVDVDRKEAGGTITYDRRIVRILDGKDVSFHEVDTPEKANAWLTRPMGERGSLLELLEWQARTGMLKAA